MVAAIALVATYVSKKQSEKSPMLAYATTISEIEAGTVRIPGDPKVKKTFKLFGNKEKEGDN